MSEIAYSLRGKDSVVIESTLEIWRIERAIALANNLTVVTHNTRKFERVDGLQLEDWEVDR